MVLEVPKVSKPVLYPRFEVKANLLCVSRHAIYYRSRQGKADSPGTSSPVLYLRVKAIHLNRITRPVPYPR